MSRIVTLVVFMLVTAVFGTKLAGMTGSTPAEADTDTAAVAVEPEPEIDPSTGKPKKLDAKRTTLRADYNGHFIANATINGKSIKVMVDTGATMVALNEETAHRLGIKMRSGGVFISTANGIIQAFPTVLKEVKIGGVVVRDVAAVVVPGNALDMNLLGMTFLKKLRKFELAGGQLVLTR